MKYTFRNVFIVSLLAAVSCASFKSIVVEEFEAFKLHYGKVYENLVEESLRLKIFMKNKLKIASHNKLFHSSLKFYSLKMNEFGDMLPSEFASSRKGLMSKMNKKEFANLKAASFIEPDDDVVLPKIIDWREMGAVTPVKDQGQCGSCWAFATTGVLEGQHFRKTGQLVSLSEQNLVDCSKSFGNEGCKGGYVENALLYVKSNHGIDTEESYPYKFTKRGKCHYNVTNSGADDVGYVQVKNGSELALQKAVAMIGPIAVAIDASDPTFQFYYDGVYISYDCLNEQQNLDHAVLVVGYGTDDNGKDYWMVKNSWGALWGIQGYMKLARNRENMCGIATDAVYPLV